MMVGFGVVDSYVMDPQFAANEARVGVVNLLIKLHKTHASDVHKRLRNASIVACTESIEALSAYGVERTARLRIARDHAGQAAAIIESAVMAGLIDASDAQGALARFHQLCTVLACTMYPPQSQRRAAIARTVEMQCAA